ncbi:MAG: AI-2E family transporter [Tissierellia bacterium]|nr:AI-2E family transporter [Tissierellia bacterium]
MFQALTGLPVYVQAIIAFLTIVLLTLLIYYLIYIGNNYVPIDRKISIRWKNIFRIFVVVVLVTVVLALFRAYPVLGTTLFAFFVSILIAYLLNPLVNLLEKKKIKRGMGTLIVYAALTLFFVGVGFLVVPAITVQIKNFINNLPTLSNQIMVWASDTLKKLNINNDELYNQVNSLITQNLSKASTTVLNWSSGVILSISGSIGKLISLVLIPIITYFLLVDKDRIIKSLKNIVPRKHYGEVRGLYHEINVAMSAFVRGRILMAIFVGVATTIYLLLFKIEFAVVIGLITMVGDIIPYIGPFLGFTPAFIFAFLQSPIKAIWVGLMFLFIQWVENNLLGPKLLGSSTGMHPLIILLSIIIGGGMFGVWGMILSVPFVSLIMILYKFFMGKKDADKIKNRI